MLPDPGNPDPGFPPTCKKCAATNDITGKTEQNK